MECSFQGTRVLITGAAGIYGRWIAQAFAREGAELFLTDRVKAPPEAGLDGAEWFLCDLGAESSAEDLLAAVHRRWSSADVLVNNAGIYPLQPLEQMTLADWDRVLHVNLRVPFILSQGVSARMRQHGVHGSIVNISSGAALRGKVGHAHYSTSKAGLEMLTRSFALELAKYGIRVNAVAPGFATGSEVSHLDAHYVHKMLATIPLARESSADDAAAAVLYLCSPFASYITGTTITADGGKGAGTYP